MHADSGSISVTPGDWVEVVVLQGSGAALHHAASSNADCRAIGRRLDRDPRGDGDRQARGDDRP